jgi:hypothetical protein
MDPIMAQLRARYVTSFPEKRALVKAALLAIPNHPGAKIDLRVLCHKLAGSAPMYEFNDIGAAARAACIAVDDNHDFATITSKIEALLDLLERGSVAA